MVEDNLLNQEFAVTTLENNGLQVTVVDNGQKALLILEQEEFDGILMDCQMPVMDGYSATRKIREQKRFYDLPIIAMTANTMSGEKQKVLDAGMNDHIPKPVNVNNMFEIMAKWIKPRKTILSTSHSFFDTVIKETDENDSLKRFADLKGIDIKEALELSENNIILYSRLLDLFQQSQNDFCDQFNLAKESNNFKEMHYLAHSLKGAAGTIGANGLQKFTLNLELACQEGEELNKEVFSLVCTELNSVIAGIEKCKQ